MGRPLLLLLFWLLLLLSKGQHFCCCCCCCSICSQVWVAGHKLLVLLVLVQLALPNAIDNDRNDKILLLRQHQWLLHGGYDWETR